MPREDGRFSTDLKNFLLLKLCATVHGRLVIVMKPNFGDSVNVRAIAFDKFKRIPSGLLEIDQRFS